MTLQVECSLFSLLSVASSFSVDLNFNFCWLERGHFSKWPFSFSCVSSVVTPSPDTENDFMHTLHYALCFSSTFFSQVLKTPIREPLILITTFVFISVRFKLSKKKEMK